MKSRYTILAACSLLFSTLAFCQEAKPTNPVRTPGVTKGYYSIGDNNRKLSPGFWRSPDTVVKPEISKGYYSIGTHNDKLKKKPVWFTKHRKRPTITKGYYSIGDHAEKLVRPM